MKNIICYYHSADLDGKCSAAIVKRKYPECELIGVDYPDKPDFDSINPGETVFVVDFSFDTDDMEKLYMTQWQTKDKCQGIDLIWIDHHKSAIEKGRINAYHNCDGTREIGKAGCELTWEYLFPEEEMPTAVKLLGRYDVFDQSDNDYWEKYILPFQYAMRLVDGENKSNPGNAGWQKLLTPPIGLKNIIKEGQLLMRYEEQQNTTYAEKMAFPVEFEGHKAWAINKALSNSKIFETLPELHARARPLWILFSRKANVWKYSLYSAPGSGIDVSEVAVKFGGGGHAGAAGFQSDKYLLGKFNGT